MPFFRKLIQKSKTGCASLQVHEPKNVMYVPEHIVSNMVFHLRKRAYLFTSGLKYTKPSRRICFQRNSVELQRQGSVTVEAAIVLFLFMMLVLFVESFMVLFHAEMDMQIKMNNVSAQIAKNMFYVEKAAEGVESIQGIGGVTSVYSEKPESSDEDSKSAGEEEAGIKTKSEAVNRALLLYQMAGTDISGSSIENGMVDIVVRKKIRMPLTDRDFPIRQRALVKDWTGSDITATSDIVYITKNGTVYHRSKNCSHLVVHIRKATVRELETLRNSSGGKYGRCTYCVKGILQPEECVFIAEDGDKYHSSLTCRGLTRSIIETDINHVGNLPPCSACGQGG